MVSTYILKLATNHCLSFFYFKKKIQIKDIFYAYSKTKKHSLKFKQHCYQKKKSKIQNLTLKFLHGKYMYNSYLTQNLKVFTQHSISYFKSEFSQQHFHSTTIIYKPIVLYTSITIYYNLWSRKARLLLDFVLTANTMFKLLISVDITCPETKINTWLDKYAIGIQS